jgi:hypothetical protein
MRFIPPLMTILSALFLATAVGDTSVNFAGNGKWRKACRRDIVDLVMIVIPGFTAGTPGGL